MTLAGDTPIVLVTANSAYIEMFLTWFARVEKVCPECVVAIIAETDDAGKLLRKGERFHVFDAEDFVDTGQSAEKSADGENGHIYGTKQYGQLMTRRPWYLQQFLQHGISLIFSDLDTIWLHDPVPVLASYGDVDAVFAHADSHHQTADAKELARLQGTKWPGQDHVSGGFMYLRANERSVGLMKAWYDEAFTGTMNINEWSLKQAIADFDVEWLSSADVPAKGSPGTALRATVLPSNLGPDGCEFWAKKDGKLLPEFTPDGKQFFDKHKSEFLYVHANCLIGDEDKITALELVAREASAPSVEPQHLEPESLAEVGSFLAIATALRSRTLFTNWSTLGHDLGFLLVELMCVGLLAWYFS